MGKMVKLKFFLLIILAALAAILIWYFRSAAPGQDVTPPTTGPVITPPTTPPPGTGELTPTPSAQSFTIEGDEFRFSPQNITVLRGATVELRFKNAGKIAHNYTVRELGVETKTIDAGKTDVVTFVAPATSGIVTYSSYCSVPGHKEAGMVGTIEIK
jgi:uncharacterized cupredoxin-like copper-binding protein